MAALIGGAALGLIGGAMETAGNTKTKLLEAVRGFRKGEGAKILDDLYSQWGVNKEDVSSFADWLRRTQGGAEALGTSQVDAMRRLASSGEVYNPWASAKDYLQSALAGWSGALPQYAQAAQSAAKAAALARGVRVPVGEGSSFMRNLTENRLAGLTSPVMASIFSSIAPVASTLEQARLQNLGLIPNLYNAAAAAYDRPAYRLLEPAGARLALNAGQLANLGSLANVTRGNILGIQEVESGDLGKWGRFVSSAGGMLGGLGGMGGMGGGGASGGYMPWASAAATTPTMAPSNQSMFGNYIGPSFSGGGSAGGLNLSDLLRIGLSVGI